MMMMKGMIIWRYEDDENNDDRIQAVLRPFRRPKTNHHPSHPLTGQQTFCLKFFCRLFTI